VVMAQIRWMAWPTFVPHNRTLWSLEPVARVCPSGLNATEKMGLVGPVRGWPNGLGWAGSVTFHNRTVLSLLLLARVCPSGLNTTEVTELVWPVRGWPPVRGKLADAMGYPLSPSLGNTSAYGVGGGQRSCALSVAVLAIANVVDNVTV